jgi:peptidoglycan hydrolase CwlO-like protein
MEDLKLQLEALNSKLSELLHKNDDDNLINVLKELSKEISTLSSEISSLREGLNDNTERLRVVYLKLVDITNKE